MRILINWLVSTLAIIIAAYLIPGVVVAGLWSALIAALVLGLVNAIIRPILIILTLPINIVTLGLFTLVINALLILLTSSIVRGFNVHGFWTAVLFGVVLMIINLVLRPLKQKKNYFEENIRQ